MAWELNPETNQLFVNGERVYVSINGGILHCMLRATSKELFWEKALEVGLAEYSNPGSPEIRNPETNDVISPETQPSGPLKPIQGVTITELGSYTITPGTYDEEGTELTPPILDTRHHVNFWLSHDLVKLGNWETWALTWTQNGTLAQANNTEEAIEFQGIELIDPTTVSSPSNILL